MKTFTRLRKPLRSLHRYSSLRQLHSSNHWRQVYSAAQPRELQKVNIHRPFTFRKGLFLVIGGACIIQYFRLLFHIRFDGDNWELAGRDNETETETKTEVDGDGSIVELTHHDENSRVIAFQHPRKLPETFYKQSDPEWEEFVRFSYDEQRKIAVRDELAQKVGNDVASHPQFSMRLGNDICVTKYWLDLKFPDSPAPQYARQGLEVTPELIAWSTQIIPQSHYIKLHHTLWPRAIFTAIRTSVSVLYHLKLLELKTFLNIRPSDRDRLLQAALLELRLHKLVENLEQASSGAATGNNDPKQPTNPHRMSIHHPELNPPQPPKTPPDTAASSLKPPDKDPVPKLDTPGGRTLYYPRITPSDNLILAANAFAMVFVDTWSQTRTDPQPQGAFFVFGLVELAGDKGRCSLQVDAAYDPKARRYSNVVVVLKELWEFSQHAKGGE